MHSMRGGVEAGRQGHGLHFSRCATTHHTRGMCVSQLSDLTGLDFAPPVERKAKALPSPAVCGRNRRYRRQPKARRPASGFVA
jgi:hypothetical protein